MSQLTSELIQDLQRERELKNEIIVQILTIEDIELLIEIKDFISSKEFTNG